MNRPIIHQTSFAVAKTAAPILNTASFESIFSGSALPLDKQGLLRAVETVVFPRTKMEILEKCSSHIVRVRIPQDYPYGDNLYVDRRFLKEANRSTLERPLRLPSPNIILKRLEKLLGQRYIWGGNVLGVPELAAFYPPDKPLDQLDPLTHDTWHLQGVDCSGLIYLATNGATPRNTSGLVTFGEPVPIANLSCAEIILKLKPLDAIVWKGHVVFVLNTTQTIESRAGFGVIAANLYQRLIEIMQERKPANEWNQSIVRENAFVVRRWHPEMVIKNVC